MSSFENPKIIHSNRKSMAASFNADGELVVKAPLKASKKSIKGFIDKHAIALWNLQQRAKNKIYLSSNMLKGKYAAFNMIAQIKSDFETIKPKAENLGLITSKEPTFKVMRSRWGSCSSDGQICLNVFLGFLPSQLIQSVIAHEFCHLKEMNHSKKFYMLLSQLDPSYKESAQALKKFIIHK